MAGPAKHIRLFLVMAALAACAPGTSMMGRRSAVDTGTAALIQYGDARLLAATASVFEFARRTPTAMESAIADQRKQQGLNLVEGKVVRALAAIDADNTHAFSEFATLQNMLAILAPEQQGTRFRAQIDEQLRSKTVRSTDLASMSLVAAATRFDFDRSEWRDLLARRPELHDLALAQARTRQLRLDPAPIQERRDAALRDLRAAKTPHDDEARRDLALNAEVLERLSPGSARTLPPADQQLIWIARIELLDAESDGAGARALLEEVLRGGLFRENAMHLLPAAIGPAERVAGLRPRIAAAVEPLIAPGDAPDLLNWLAPFGGKSFLPLARARLETESDVADAAKLVSYAMSAAPAEAAQTAILFCNSPAGQVNARVVPRWGPTTGAPQALTDALQKVPEATRAGLLGERWSRQGRASSSLCEMVLVRSLSTSLSGLTALDGPLDILRQVQPQLAAEATADEALRRTVATRSRCDRLRTEAGGRSSPVKATNALSRMLVLDCPDAPSRRFARSAHPYGDGLGPEERAWMLDHGIWRMGGAAEGQLRLLAAMLEDPANSNGLAKGADYASALVPLMTEDQPVELGDLPAAGALALLMADDPHVTRWIIRRTAGYETGSKADVADLLAVAAAAWRAAGAETRHAQKVYSEEGLSPSSRTQQAWARRELLVRRRVAGEVNYALNVLCAQEAVAAGRKTITAPAMLSVGCFDRPAAEQARVLLKVVGDTDASFAGSLQSHLQRRDALAFISTTLKFLAGHLAFWLLLLAAYPRSKTVRAIFFWNPWVRRLVGLGYIQLLLTTVPWLQGIILSPFRANLLRDGRVSEFQRDAYFNRVPATLQAEGQAVDGAAADLARRVTGQLLVIGASGTGKTWLLRDLASRAAGPIAYLNATSCDAGVLKAIADRCEGWAQDPDFLNPIIYAGGLTIIIDGLNEVEPTLRGQIIAFANAKASTRVILATQELSPSGPKFAQTLELHPLARDDIGAFLHGRVVDLGLKDEAAQTFYDAVEAFMAAIASGKGDRAQEALLGLISNPMDLRSAAELLAVGEPPDLLRLQQQLVERAARSYEASHRAPFPKAEIAQYVYDLRVANRPVAFPERVWPKEREALAEGRLVVPAFDPLGRREWRFRHDTITSYFLLLAFEAEPHRYRDHATDSRFSGVFVMLARSLPPEAAQTVLDKLMRAAVRKQDFTNGNAFFQSLAQRLASEGAELADDDIASSLRPFS